MRDFKFRAWSISGKQMIGWEKMKEDRKLLYKYFEWDDVYHLMLYTGLNDRNGKEIYEGDILKTRDLFNDSRPYWQVVWDNEMLSAEFIVKQIGGSGEVFSTDDFFVNLPDAIVVGNVHEHPELLEGSQC